MKIAIPLFLLVSLINPLFGATKYPGFGVDTNEAMRKLKRGHERFFRGEAISPRQDPEHREYIVSKGQAPYATVLACSDSRKPVELIFDAGFGDLFVVRIAGNTIGTDQAGSIEYGTGVLKTPLLVVLGHTHCGAVKAAIDDYKGDNNIEQLLMPIKYSVDMTREKYPKLEGEMLTEMAIQQNVFNSIEDLFLMSKMVVQLVKQGELKVVGAVYDLETGEIEWLGEHPEETSIIYGDS